MATVAKPDLRGEHGTRRRGVVDGRIRGLVGGRWSDRDAHRDAASPNVAMAYLRSRKWRASILAFSAPRTLAVA